MSKAHETPEQTLARWQAEEAEVRARRSELGVISREQFAARTGLEVFDAMFSGELPQPFIGAALNFLPIRMAHGVAIFQGRPSREQYNPMGGVHGGWYCTLLDSALGCAVQTVLPKGRGYTTLEIKVNMVRGLTDQVPLVRAEGRIVHTGRSTATSEARLVGHDGKLYAHASATCLIMDLPS